MLILVAYDVCTEDDHGKRRLNKIAKCCVRYGQRVQKSVFECKVDPVQKRKLTNEITMIMNAETDSIRIYNLGDNYQTRMEVFGNQKTYDPEGLLIL